MAAEDEVVRISYQELQDIVKERVEREIQEQELKLEEEAKKAKNEERKKKRPTVGIYRPPSVLRHKKELKEKEGSPSDDGKTTDSNSSKPAAVDLHISEEDWDSEIASSEPTSKENSVEKEVEVINSGVKSMTISSTSSSGRSKPAEDTKKRSKRPEIQRYVPKGRLMEKQAPDLSGEGSGDLDPDSSPSRNAVHSPSPGPGGKAAHSPSPRKVDLKNMQITVANSLESDSQQGNDLNIQQNIPATVGQKFKEHSGNQRGQGRGQGQSYSRGRGQRLNQRSEKGFGQNVNEYKGKGDHVGSRGNSREKDVLVTDSNVQKEEDLYIVPSRPNTIGQEADRVDTLGSDSQKLQGDEPHSRRGDNRMFSGERANKPPSYRSKSRSFDKLNQSERWEEEGYYQDSSNMGTLIFERSHSSEQLNIGGRSSTKPPMPRSSSGGNKPAKKYSFQSMRPRRDSFSSDISTGTTGSDWSTEDLDFDKEIEDRKVDWTEEVDTQLALQVQDETQKMNAWFARQEETGLSQSADCLDQTNNALDNYGGGRVPEWGSPYSKQGDMSGEKSNTLPFTHRRKHNNVNVDNQLRGRNADRRKGSLGFRSRDSSVSSVQSCQSVQSVQSAYGSEGRRRRRRRRKSSTGSQKMRSGSMESMNIQVHCGTSNKREVTVDPSGKGLDNFNRMNSFEKRDNYKSEDWNRRGEKGQRDQGRGQFRGNKGFGSSENMSYSGQKDSWGRGDKQQRSPRYEQDRQGQNRGQKGDRQRQESGGNREKGSQRYRHDSGESYNRNDGRGPRGGWRENRRNDRNNRDDQQGYHDDRRGSDQRGGKRDDERYDRYSHDLDVKRQSGHSQSSQNKEPDKPHPHSGGLIHLPPKSQTPEPAHREPTPQKVSHSGNWTRDQSRQGNKNNWGGQQQQLGHNYNRGHSDNMSGSTRGRGDRHNSGGRKTLFDPNNPSKPIVIDEGKPKLEFKDPDNMYGSSPQSPPYPNPAHSPHYPSGQGQPASPQQGGYPGPGYGQFYPPGYGYGYNMPPPMGMMPPPGSEGMFYGYPHPHARDWSMYQEDPYYQRNNTMPGYGYGYNMPPPMGMMPPSGYGYGYNMPPPMGMMPPSGYGYGYNMPPPMGMMPPSGYGYGYNMPTPMGMMPPPGSEGMFYGYPHPHARDWNMYQEDPYYQGNNTMPGYGYGYNMPPPMGMMAPPGSEGMFYGYPHPHARDWSMYQEDPYYQGGMETDLPMSSDRSRSQCRMIAEQILREAIPMEKQLVALISRRINGRETLHMINQLRGELQRRFEQLILLDPELSNKHNVEQMLWKSVFYHMVESIRRQIAEQDDTESGNILNKVLDEGTSFYENLLEKLQTTFSFRLETFLDPNTPAPENIGRSAKLALLSAQRTMICLGDIARYKEQKNEGGKVNYGKARSWYTKAQQIDPKNGRPYNQLAILALYTKRKLDAVYYYMRSLAARNPFITARESLMSLFDEARKKAEEMERKRIDERKKQQQIKKTRGLSKHRLEIWVKNDGTSSESKLDDNYDEDLSKLDTVQLNKRFVLSFLNVHGKLFTKIGMETFEDSCGQMLMEFKVLLKDNAITPLRLLQLMAINMFAIENTALKDESLESTCKSLLQQHSVQLGLDMFGIMVERCSQLLDEHIKSSDYPGRLLCRELEELIPGIKVWIGWMMGNPNLWNPPPAVRDPSMGPEIDVWACIAKLCNILKGVDISHVELLRDKTENSEVVILSEDTMMAGFVPLLSTPYTSTNYVDRAVDKELARDCLRLSKLKLFEQYLCGIDPPMLAYDGTTKLCCSIAPSQGYEDLKRKGEENEESEDDIVIESEEEIIQEGGIDDEHVQELRAKKEELKRKMEEQIRQKETRKKIIEDNCHRSIEIEIRPIFLIPDTNCFIDHLPSMQKLIKDKQYTIVIPLVVINELDGLAQGQRQGQFDSEEHAHKVKTYARTTINYLEDEFEKKHTHLKALTSKGTEMETISFRSEDTDKSGNNDDLILSCCTYYCKDKARDFMPKDKDAPVRLYREVVLLTDDRNLRLKAHTHNVPVKELPAFMKWTSGT